MKGQKDKLVMFSACWVMLLSINTSADQPAAPPPSYTRLSQQFSELVNRFSDVAALRENTAAGERARYFQLMARTHASYAELVYRTDRIRFLLPENAASVTRELDGFKTRIAGEVNSDLKQVNQLAPGITNDILREYILILQKHLDQFHTLLTSR